MCGVSRPRPMSAYNVCGLCLCVWVGVGVTDRQRHGEQERLKPVWLKVGLKRVANFELESGLLD